MAHKLERTQLTEGVFFSAVTDSKFKHNRISISFITPLKKETAADNAVVPFLLRRGSKSCPDYTELERKLCRLYGASLDADVSKVGEYQIVGISVQCIDDRYSLEGEKITAQCAALLADLAFDPCIINGQFDEEITAREREFLVDTIAAEINDKRSYALRRCKEHMCEGEAISLRKYGELDSAAAITGGSAATAYRNLREKANIEIMFVGSGSPASTRDIFKNLFAGIKRSAHIYKIADRKPAPATPREHIEKMEVAQSKLVMGLRVDAVGDYSQLRPVRVMAALLGGTPFSRLFVNVREKLSLCYYCAARYDGASGLLSIDSGIEAENKQKAQDEIMAQIEVIKRGEFTDEELISTKLALGGSMSAVCDSQGALESWYLTQIFMNSDISPEENAKAINNVTKEQIVQAAREVHLDTVYFLTDEKGGDTE